MVGLRMLEQKDFAALVQWNKDKGADFLTQWSGGTAYYYPLRETQLATRLDYSKRKHSDFHMFAVENDGELVGAVEIFNINMEDKTATMGRFILREDCRGKGIGCEAVKAVCHTAKKSYLVEVLYLYVYEYNISAQKCYEKAGFELDEIIPNEQNLKWTRYRYIIELYAYDTETWQRTIPQVEYELTEEDKAGMDISV